MSLPNPVIRSHYGNGFIKQYVRDHLILRTEAASNNVNDYGVKKAVENLPVLQNALSAINDNYQRCHPERRSPRRPKSKDLLLVESTTAPNTLGAASNSEP